MTTPLRTALIGFGNVSAGLAQDEKMRRYFPYATHAQVLKDHPEYEWVAVVDPRQEAREAARTEWQVPFLAQRVSELPGDLILDIAVIATPPGERLDSLPAATSLRGLMVEKPLGRPNSTDRHRFIDACRALRVPVQVNFWRRADPVLQKLRAGELAKRVGSVQAVFGLYGNGLYNNAGHLVDMVRMLLGEVIEVCASSDFAPELRGPVPDDCRVAFTLRLDTGPIVAVQPIDFNHYREVSLDIWGSHGRLMIAQEGLGIFHHPRQPHRALMSANEIACDGFEQIAPTAGEALYGLYSNLAESIRHGVPLVSPLESATRTEFLLDAVMRSAQNGRAPIACDPGTPELI
jgi:predicted dehydrogenase